jgi:hypothetical protein
MDTTIPWRAEHYMFAAFIVLLALWVTLSFFVIANRVLFERRRRQGESNSGPVDVDQLLRDAALRGARHKWRRISALGTLAARHADRAYDALERALGDADAEVANTAAVNLHRIGDRRAAAILISALRVRPHAIPASRVATHLDQFPAAIDDLLRALLTDPDRDRRYWASALLARYPRADDVALDLAPLADDEHPQVRKATVASLGWMNPAVAVPIAQRKLDDAVPYVRSAAARALGRLGSAEPDLARRRSIALMISPLLADARWEVRLAAKESLTDLGPAIWREVATMLDSRDDFARHGAAEVLQNLGIVDWTLGGLTHGAVVSNELKVMLTQALRDGGSALADTAALRDPDSIREINLLVPGRVLTGVT